MKLLNFDEIYENWDTYKACRILIPGESMWGRELPDGLIGIDNMPLHGDWQWQDIVRSKHLGEGEEAVRASLVHRRWHHKMYYRYEADTSIAGAHLEQRKKMLAALESLGRPGFWSDGIGYVLVKEANLTPDECFQNIKLTLQKVGVTVLEDEP